MSLPALCGSGKALPCGAAKGGGGGGIDVDGDCAALPLWPKLEVDGRMGGRCPPRREGEPRLDDACGGAKYSEEPEKVPLQPSAENLVLILSSLRLLPFDVGLVNMLGGTGIENLFE